jgi:urease gamma subunit
MSRSSRKLASTTALCLEVHTIMRLSQEETDELIHEVLTALAERRRRGGLLFRNKRLTGAHLSVSRTGEMRQRLTISDAGEVEICKA